MHRFFAERTGENAALLPPDEARHALTVLRLKPGDHIAAIVDEALYLSEISSAEGGVTVRLLSPLPSPEARLRVTLYQGLPKGDKMDFLIQKCTEAGVYSIVPVQMPRCVVRLTEKDGQKKAERWQRIALEAAKQSGRTHVPKVEAPIAEKELLKRVARCALCLTPWEDARGLSVKGALAGQTADELAFVIGPEGGMGADEIEALKQAGAIPVTLGRRIFRTETAGLAALIMALSASGDYEG